MKSRVVSIFLIVASVFFVGCNKETNSSSPETSSSIENKKDEQNDIEVLFFSVNSFIKAN